LTEYTDGVTLDPMSDNHLPAATGWAPARDGTAIIYLVKGRGRAVVLLRSGTGPDIAAAFDHLVSTHHHVVLINQRHGPDWGENPSRDETLDLLDVLHKIGPATLVAGAQGARTAIAAALAEPESIHHLALYEPTAPDDDSPAGLRIPVLLMVGYTSPDDLTAGACELAALCPNALLITLTAADGTDPFDVPGVVGQAIQDFLDNTP
jgi:pimeloyl-ACP methyl ester carboxylesterase